MIYAGFTRIAANNMMKLNTVAAYQYIPAPVMVICRLVDLTGAAGE